MATGTSRNSLPFEIPKDIAEKAEQDTEEGIRILLKPTEAIKMMAALDRAFNRGPVMTNACFEDVAWVREKLSDLFECPTRRRRRP